MIEAAIKLDEIFEMHHLNMVWLKMQWWFAKKNFNSRSRFILKKFRRITPPEWVVYV